MTTGLTLFGVIIVGDWPKSGFADAATTPAAVVVWTNWRRLTLRLIVPPCFPTRPARPASHPPSSDSGEHVGRDNHTLRFGRPLIDFGRAHVTEEPLDDRATAVAGGGKNLHRLVGRLVGRFRRGQLGHRRFSGQFFLL